MANRRINCCLPAVHRRFTAAGKPSGEALHDRKTIGRACHDQCGHPDPRPIRLPLPWSVELANAVARELLGDGERYRHSQGVAERARELSITVPADRADLLISAAWLHDIGYAASLRRTGFHPLDGARELMNRGADTALVRLVANHSAARLVACVRRLDEEMAAFAPLPGPVADALTAADQTVGPEGAAMTVDERMRDMLNRHGPNSPHARVHAVRGPQLRATAARVASRLARLGVTDPWLSSWPSETSAAS